MQKDFYSFLLLDIFLFVYFTELVFPPSIMLGNQAIICMCCSSIWLVLSYFFNSHFYNNSDIHRYFVLVFYFATILIPYLADHPIISHRYALSSMVPMGTLIYEYYRENDKINHLKNLITIAVILSFFTLLTTYGALLSNPFISRSIKSSGEEALNLYAKGIGGYSFIYYIVVCSQIVLFLFFKRKKNILLFFYFFLLSFILKANYFTALFLTVLGSVFMTVFFLYKNNISHKFLLIFFILAVFFVILNFNIIFDLFKDFFPTRIQNIFSQKNESLYDAVLVEFTSDRWPAIKTSLNSFFTHPLVGVVFAEELLLNQGLNSNLLGQHSYFFDTFALYGVGVGLMNFFVLLRPFKRNGILVKENLFLTIPIMVVSFGIYIFNNVTDSIAFAVGILYPFARDYFYRG